MSLVYNFDLSFGVIVYGRENEVLLAFSLDLYLFYTNDSKKDELVEAQREKELYSDKGSQKIFLLEVIGVRSFGLRRQNTKSCGAVSQKLQEPTWSIKLAIRCFLGTVFVFYFSKNKFKNSKNFKNFNR